MGLGLGEDQAARDNLNLSLTQPSEAGDISALRPHHTGCGGLTR